MHVVRVDHAVGFKQGNFENPRVVGEHQSPEMLQAVALGAHASGALQVKTLLPLELQDRETRAGIKLSAADD